MALSDAQIERFSRQIVLPQIGGTGQARLLQSSVAVAGSGRMAEIVALYLAGAGVGRIEVHRLDGGRLAADLAALETGGSVQTSARQLAESGCDVRVGCDLPLADLAGAAAVGRVLVAGGTQGGRGWLVVAEPGGACAVCAARTALETGVASSDDRSGGRPDPRAAEAPLAGVAAGVIGSLAAVSVVKQLLGLGVPSPPVWVDFDAAGSMLSEHPLAPAADCAACAAAAVSQVRSTA